MEPVPNEPQNSVIASYDIRQLEKNTFALMNSCSFGVEIEWRKTTAPARVVFPLVGSHFPRWATISPERRPTHAKLSRRKKMRRNLIVFK
jgi:hypothetical protein